MKSQIRTFLAVALLTVTIWVWADLEQVQQTGIVVENVEVLVPQNYEIERISPARLKVVIEARQREIQDLRHSPELHEARFDLRDREIADESLSLPVVEGFRHWAGVRIVEILEGESDRRVDQVTVALDRQTQVPVPVRVNVLGATATDASAIPPEVTATVSASDLAELPEGKRYARATVEVKAMQPGRLIEEAVALEPRLGGADGIPARFSPPRVLVRATLESALKTQTLKGVRVVLVVSPDKLKDYEIVFQDDAPPGPVELEVEGRPALVEPLTPEKLSLQVIINPDDKPVEGAWIGRDPMVVGLPPGVTVVGRLPTVNFNLKRRAGP